MPELQPDHRSVPLEFRLPAGSTPEIHRFDAAGIAGANAPCDFHGTASSVAREMSSIRVQKEWDSSSDNLPERKSIALGFFRLDQVLRQPGPDSNTLSAIILGF